MSLTDEQLIELIVLRGDSESFRTLVERYQSYVFTLMYRTLGDRGAAEDLAQETFMAVYRTLGAFRGDARFSTWLYRIAANVLHDELRKRKRRRIPLLWGSAKPSGEQLIETTAEREDEPEERLLRTEERETVARLFAKLPEKYRVILTLYYFNRLTASDIAAAVDLPIKTVETRLVRGRQRLKQLWTEEEDRYEQRQSIERQSPIGKPG